LLSFPSGAFTNWGLAVSHFDEDERSYVRNCLGCGGKILMAFVGGRHVPLELGYNGYHDCYSRSVQRLPRPERKKLALDSPPPFNDRGSPMWETLIGTVVAIEPRDHPRITGLWLVVLLYFDMRLSLRRDFRTKITVDTEFPLGARIRGRTVNRADDVGTFLNGATHEP
jgi:hypothetical protein